MDAYLKDKCTAKTPDEFFDLKLLDKILATRSLKKIHDTMTKLDNSKATNNEKNNTLFA
jgi:hypothetical protein